MKVLILSANTGQGHNSCAAAVKEAFEARGDSCTVRDCIAFMSEGISGFVAKLHVWIYRNLPGAFSWGYKVAQKHPAVFGRRSPLYAFFVRGAKNLEEYADAEGFDIVIACHVFAAVVLSEASDRKKKPFKTAFIATDFTRSPSVEQSCLDYYFIPAQILKDEFTAGRITPEKIFASGIPVRRAFCAPADKKKAKRQLGVSPENRHLIVMCGSMGCGPVYALAKALMPLLCENNEISILCGTNEKLRKRLERRFGNDPRCHIYGYVDDTAVFMDSADLYLTKPGGISVCEAAAKRLPMLFVNAVAGCEEYNLRYFVETGGAVSEDTVSAIAKTGAALLNDEKKLAGMSLALKDAVPCGAAENICDILKKT